MSHLEKNPPGDGLVGQLRAMGYRITPPRRAVLKVFARGEAHLSPDEVLARARRTYPKVGRATVYRTLELLTHLGVTRPMFRGDGRPAFARVHHGHHHVVCSACDRVVELAQPALDHLARQAAARTGFEIHSHVLEFVGLCRRCSRGRTARGTPA